MVGTSRSKRVQWSQATLAALLGLAENFPRERCLRVDDARLWGFLTPEWFPCQKTDAQSHCPGWSLSPELKFGSPGVAQNCPCVFGRSKQFGPLIDLAGEFSRANPRFDEPVSAKSLSYITVESDEKFLNALLTWLWIAAAGNYEPQQDVEWIEQIRIAQLNQEQRQTMRWWSRLSELSTLVHNEKFTLLLKRSIEAQFRHGGMSSVSRLLDILELREDQCVVLALDGHELTPTGFHSEKNLWFEVFLSVVDERRLGLCLISKQPVFSDVGPDNWGRDHSEYRWRAKHAADGQRYPLEQVLRRGAWDRLCEALARGDWLAQRL